VCCLDADPIHSTMSVYEHSLRHSHFRHCDDQLLTGLLGSREKRREERKRKGNGGSVVSGVGEAV
jgi:hypothetical protein